MQRLAEGLGAGALPAVTWITLICMHVGEAGASALAAALGRGALPRLKTLILNRAAIGDVGLVALAPALRRLSALQQLALNRNPFGDEGIAALVAPPPLPAGAPPTTNGVLTKLEVLSLCNTQVSDAGCAALVSALDRGALPELEGLFVSNIPARAGDGRRVGGTRKIESRRLRSPAPATVRDNTESRPPAVCVRLFIAAVTWYMLGDTTRASTPL